MRSKRLNRKRTPKRTKRPKRPKRPNKTRRPKGKRTKKSSRKTRRSFIKSRKNNRKLKGGSKASVFPPPPTGATRFWFRWQDPENDNSSYSGFYLDALPNKNIPVGGGGEGFTLEDFKYHKGVVINGMRKSYPEITMVQVSTSPEMGRGKGDAEAVAEGGGGAGGRCREEEMGCYLR